MIRYSKYAERRIRKRKIPLELISKTIEKPGQQFAERGRLVAQSRFDAGFGNEHLLRVVYEMHGNDAMVITVYETSRIAKYWRPQ